MKAKGITDKQEAKEKQLGQAPGEVFAEMCIRDRDSTFICHFKTPYTVGAGIGKRPFLMAEHLALEQALRDATKVHLDKGLLHALDVYKRQAV